jgi:phosphate transport system permease protein
MAIVAFLLARGAAVLDWTFLTDRPRGMPLGTAGGIGPAISGSLALAGLALVVALPAAVAGAVWLSEYATRLGRPLRGAAECMAAVPAIVYGLFGYAFLVVVLNLRLSLLSGALTLALMMFPMLLVGSHAALTAVDPAVRESALALGVTRWNVARRLLLRHAWPGILAVTVLAAGHAIGSAAPVLYTASVAFSRGGLDLRAPVMTLPTHLYHLVGEATSFDHAYGTAAVLVVGLLLANTCALLLKRRIA